MTWWKWLGLSLLLALALGLFGWGVWLSADRAQRYLPAPDLTPTVPPTPTAQDPRFVIHSVEYLTGTVRVAFTSRQIKGDWLYEAPVLRVGDREYAPSAASLKQARLALLQTITAGTASTTLEFEKVAADTTSGYLILNPASQSTSIVSPRLDLGVRWRPADKTEK